MGRGRGAPEGGETRVHLWLIHAGAWQKATPHYKASVLQLKTKTLKLKGKENTVPRNVIYSWEPAELQAGVLCAKRNESAREKQETRKQALRMLRPYKFWRAYFNVGFGFQTEATEA